MIRLPRHRDLDPDLRRCDLPFFLRLYWIGLQVGFALVAQFMWALITIGREPVFYRRYLRYGVWVFVLAVSLGYFFARLGSRFVGANWLKIRRGKERVLDSWLGRATVASGIALVALPQVVNSLFAWEFLTPIPFYSGAVVGMSFSLFLWVIGLPR